MKAAMEEEVWSLDQEIKWTASMSDALFRDGL